DHSLCLGDANPDPFDRVPEFAPGSMRAIPGATREDEFVARWAAKGGGWDPPLVGAALPFVSCKSMELDPRAGPSRGTWSSWCLQKDRISARKVRDEGQVFSCRITSSELFASPPCS